MLWLDKYVQNIHKRFRYPWGTARQWDITLGSVRELPAVEQAHHLKIFAFTKNRDLETQVYDFVDLKY